MLCYGNDEADAVKKQISKWEDMGLEVSKVLRWGLGVVEW